MSKKIGLMVIVTMLATALLVSDSSAAVTWHTCTVDLVGPEGGNVYIQLTSSAFTKRWFIVPATSQKEVLAVALTALANGMTVKISTDLSLSGNPPILAIYLSH